MSASEELGCTTSGITLSPLPGPRGPGLRPARVQATFAHALRWPRGPRPTTRRGGCSDPPLHKIAASPITGCLQLEHLCVSTAMRDQMRMGTLLGHPTVAEDDDAVGHANRGKAMRDEQRRLPGRELRESLEHLELRVSVE